MKERLGANLCHSKPTNLFFLFRIRGVRTEAPKFLKVPFFGGKVNFVFVKNVVQNAFLPQ
jgi:hypothetical protein